MELLDLGVEKATNIMVSHRYKQQEGERAEGFKDCAKLACHKSDVLLS